MARPNSLLQFGNKTQRHAKVAP